MIFRWLDRVVSCGTPTQWQRVHATMVLIYIVNVPLFVWWAVTLNETALLIQLGGITVTTAVESSMAGLHASAVQEKQEADSDSGG